MELHGGNIYKVAKEYNLKKADIIDFSSNINPLGVSSKLKNAIINNLDIIQSYPDPEYQDLKLSIAQYTKTATGNILTGNGATELIYLFARTLRPKTALIIAPAFAEYALALVQAGTKINYFKLDIKDDFNLDLNALKEELKKSYDLLVICNPNNPTGAFLRSEHIENIISYANKNNTKVMLDESFIEFVEPGLASSNLALYNKYKNLFILRSLTKFFAIPGLRLGYAVAFNNGLASRLKKNQEPWTVNQIAELAARVLLNDKDYIRETVKYVDAERLFLYKALGDIAWLKPFKPAANFLLLKILNDISSAGLKAGLLKHGLLIRDASNFKFLNNKFVRIAVKDRESNEMLLKNLCAMSE